MTRRVNSGLAQPSPAFVVSLTALIVALGGTSYAAFSLQKNSVATAQLKNGAVTTTKIKNHAVTAHKINATGLTVPNALHATNATHASSAASLGGVQKLNWRVPSNTAAQTIYKSPGGLLTVKAACDAGSNITLTLTTSVNHAVLDSYGYQTDVQRPDFVTGTPVTFTNSGEERTIVYTAPGGQIVTLIYAVNNSPNLPGVHCLLDGTASAS